jgi:hypothetical protein
MRKGVFQNGNFEISWTNDSEFEVESYLIEGFRKMEMILDRFENTS